MKGLFEPTAVTEITDRLARLRPDSERQWGKMDVAQMLAHCSAAIGLAEGSTTPPRMFLGRLLGPIAKKSLIIKGEPMRRNAMTVKSALVTDKRDFSRELQHLRASIDHFAAGGPAVCTKHPHFFFGPLTPTEWSALMYQHLDHHLRQFGV